MPTRAENRRAAEAAAAEDTSNESEESKAHRGYVRYVNTATIRRITPEDLAEVGIPVGDQKVLEWSAVNQWTVPRADITDAVYERAIEPDKDFILVEGE